MLSLLIWVFVVALLAALAIFVLQQLRPPDPLYKVFYVGIVVLAVIIVVYLLLGAVGEPVLRLR